MKLSLSVRIVESPCKTRLLVPFEELLLIAQQTGYDAVCLRASAGGIGTPPARLAALRRLVEGAGLCVSMVTADCDVPRNNDHEVVVLVAQAFIDAPGGVALLGRGVVIVVEDLADDGQEGAEDGFDDQARAADVDVDFE